MSAFQLLQQHTFICPRSDGPCNDAFPFVRGMFCMWVWMGVHTPVTAGCAFGGALCPSCVTRALCSAPVWLLVTRCGVNASAAGVARASEPARACIASASSITCVIVAPQRQCCGAGAESHTRFLGKSAYGSCFAFAGACQCPTTKHCRLRWGCHLGSVQLLGPDCSVPPRLHGLRWPWLCGGCVSTLWVVSTGPSLDRWKHPL